MANSNETITLRALRVGAALLSILVSCTCCVQARSFYDDMLFHPRTEYRSNAQTLGSVEKKEVTFTAARGEKLKGWYYDKPGSDKIVLISEGNGGNMAFLAPLAEILLQCNCSVMLYDYEGYGDSEGTPSLRRVIDDAMAAYDYMKTSFAGDKKIILLGVSLGTGVTCQLSTHRKADAIILSSPFSSLLSMARQKVGFIKFVPTFALPRQHLDNVAVLKKSHPPVLILHGTADEMIPIAEAEKLYAQAIQPKEFVKLSKAGHNDTFRRTKDEYMKAVQTFLEQLPETPK